MDCDGMDAFNRLLERVEELSEQSGSLRARAERSEATAHTASRASERAQETLKAFRDEAGRVMSRLRTLEDRLALPPEERWPMGGTPRSVNAGPDIPF